MKNKYGKRIRLFNKTPPDIICPHFWEFIWARGCPYSCAWCYLQGTYRIQGKQPYPYPVEEVRYSLKRFFNEVEEPQILNSGELADSLMYEFNPEYALSNWIPNFEGPENRYGHKLLILTKTVNVQNLLYLRNHYTPKHVIVSWSLNADSVAERWERGAPRVENRLKAGRDCYFAGYRVRVRIDPMVPIEYWPLHYQRLIDSIFKNFLPERITLGSLRGLQSTINMAQDKSWVPYLGEKSGWGLKISSPLRQSMYQNIIDHLKTNYGYGRVALCKETREMWDAVGLNPMECRCNCAP